MPPPTDIEWGGIHLGMAQGLRVNVAWDPHNMPPNMPPPVTVEFMIHDADGNVIGRSEQALLPGKVISFDSRAIIAIRPGLIQPCIRTIIDPNVLSHVTATLEVYDTLSGRTLFALNNPTVLTEELPQ